MNGAIAYRGPSLLDGAPIVMIVTGLERSSANPKTGAMIQSYILKDDRLRPLDHVKLGTDGSICGDCKFSKGRGCYVNISQGPNSIYRALQRGVYPALPPEFVAVLIGGRPVRLGSYGDPAAVPHQVLVSLTQFSKHTGYTHQWRRFPHLRSLCMASVDTEHERAEARALGFRTFRVGPHEGWSLLRGEILCPASAEAGKLTDCASCGLCAGARRIAKDILIPAHGIQKRKAMRQIEEAA